MRRILLALCFACASASAALPAHPPQYETIVGQVAAYSGPLECFSGTGYWSVIIRVQEPKNTHSKFVRVDFGLPCEKSPVWISAKPPVERFRLNRHKECDAVLKESMEMEQKREVVIPMWQYPSGATHERLPFGEVVPCYEPVDLPLARGL